MRTLTLPLMMIGALLGCAETVTAPPDTAADVAGRVAFVQLNPGATRFLVESLTVQPERLDASTRQVLVSFSGDTPIVVVDAAGRGHAGTSRDLQVGARVRVWVDDFVKLSNPPQLGGLYIEVRDGGTK